MAHLQQLHGPLDVGQPAAAELEVGGRIGAARQPLVVDAGLDPAYLGDVALAEPGLRVAQRVDHLGEPAAQVAVADHGVGAQQRLRLPDRRPLGVVGGVRAEGAGHRAALALGAEVGVDLERRVATRRRQQPAQLVGDRLGHARGLLRVGARQRVVHEHHVGVRAVAELAAAVAAHRDDRHPGRHRSLPLGLDGADRDRRARPPAWRRRGRSARSRPRPPRTARTGRPR